MELLKSSEIYVIKYMCNNFTLINTNFSQKPKNLLCDICMEENVCVV